jgi:hypothetical protein
MHSLKNTVIFICLVAFVISTTGISFQIHSCRMSGKTKIALFPGIAGHTSGCCEKTKPLSTGESDSYGKIPCCTTITKYSKISVSYNSNSCISVISPVKVTDNFIIQSPICDLSQKSIPTNYRPPPLQFVGKALLHFIQSIKIGLS